MTPLQFRPLVKRARWGGTRLGTLLGKSVGSETDYAESWEFADHGPDQSVIVGGECDGLTLQQLVRDHNLNRKLFGRHAGLKQFPLLVKFLDATDRLSVQVHPNDVQARVYQSGENGKTEAWVVVSAEPGSKVFAGLKSSVDAFRLERHLKDGTLEECLHQVEVRAGDCLFIPAGTVHAIGEGIVLAEVQQSSDLTFRLSDWGRLGANGLPRELHIEESLACIDWDRGPVDPAGPRLVVAFHESRSRYFETEELVTCDYFVLHRHRGTTSFSVNEHDCFHALLVLEGSGELVCGSESIALKAGSSVLVPASSSDRVEVVPHGEIVVLDAFLPREVTWLPMADVDVERELIPVVSN